MARSSAVGWAIAVDGGIVARAIFKQSGGMYAGASVSVNVGAGVGVEGANLLVTKLQANIMVIKRI